MQKLQMLFLLLVITMDCQNKKPLDAPKILHEKTPDDTPLVFLEKLTPQDKLIHKGIFGPDLETYYFTISDTGFEHFDVYFVEKIDGQWSQAQSAFFNSQYNEHGMSFSPDGNTLYFSSTRPVQLENMPSTWHIWKSDLVQGQWTEPSYVDIPNMRDKLVSHPSISRSGTLYFHSSNLDYSEMYLYNATRRNNAFEEASKVSISNIAGMNTCTPYVSPDDDYLIFATIGEALDLMISFPDGKGSWTSTRKLNNKINHQGQGNPYVTPDNTYLFFTVGDDLEKKWQVKWVHIKSELQAK